MKGGKTLSIKRSIEKFQNRGFSTKDLIKKTKKTLAYIDKRYEDNLALMVQFFETNKQKHRKYVIAEKRWNLRDIACRKRLKILENNSIYHDERICL